MPKLSVAIIAKDEEENIGDCLESIKWADEIVVVVDDRTTDKTAEIAKKYTDKVFWHKFESFGQQKEFGLKRATGDWVLSLDADERVTPKLRREILQKIKSTEFAGYHTFFHEIFLGKDIKPVGKGTQGTVRLFRRNKAKFVSKRIHERLVVEGKIGQLENYIVHHSHRTVFQTLEKFNQFTSLEARELYEAGGRTNLVFILGAPLFHFFRQYFSWGAYRYGMHGVLMGIMRAVYYLMKHLKIWELQQKSGVRSFR